MSQLALDLGVPSTLVTEAVYRPLPVGHEGRARAGEQGPQRPSPSIRETQARPTQEVHRAVRQALYASKICSYAQGFVQLQAAAEGARLAAELRRHRPACGAAAASSARVFLERIKEAFDKNPKLENLLLDALFHRRHHEGPSRLAARRVAPPSNLGIPVARVFSTALAYYDGYRRDRLPANLLQASAITSALTRISASISRACFTRNGWN